ncbi:MAG: hypothetical protein AMJ89_04410 [candidate division Zixibacteria bacterium SM23_73]|nr:MAG: hypothetical protein AMJ89_04410 [candidate division Zixibacteria bacterium SM23_73]
MRILSRLIICGFLLLMMGAIYPAVAQVINVYIDIKPQSCPNSLNPYSKGVVSVAILGTEDFDVIMVDPATVRLQDRVAPLRWSYEDVSTPADNGPDPEECTTEGADGYMDLVLKFKTQEIFAQMDQFSDGYMMILTLYGFLFEEYDGSAIMGEDMVRIIVHDM